MRYFQQNKNFNLSETKTFGFQQSCTTLFSNFPPLLQLRKSASYANDWLLNILAA